MRQEHVVKIAGEVTSAALSSDLHIRISTLELLRTWRNQPLQEPVLPSRNSRHLK